MSRKHRCHVASWLEKYLDRELHPVRRVRVRFHLRNCSFCARVHHFQHRLRVIIRERVRVDPPPQFTERIRRHIEDQSS